MALLFFPGAIFTGLVLGGATFHQMFSWYLLPIILMSWAIVHVVMRNEFFRSFAIQIDGSTGRFGAVSVVFDLLRFGMSYIVGCIIVCGFCYLAGAALSSIVSDMRTHTVTGNLPGRSLLQNGTLVFPNDSTETMVSASAECTVKYENGEPYESKEREMRGPAMPGGSVMLMPYSSWDYRDLHLDKDSLTCRVTSATYRENIPFDLSLENSITKDGQRFVVRNNGNVAVRHVQFECTLNGSTTSTTVIGKALYSKAGIHDPTIFPGKSITYDTDGAAYSENCVISNAVRA